MMAPDPAGHVARGTFATLIVARGTFRAWPSLAGHVARGTFATLTVLKGTLRTLAGSRV
jgi:hypothetical protein